MGNLSLRLIFVLIFQWEDNRIPSLISICRSASQQISKPKSYRKEYRGAKRTVSNVSRNYDRSNIVGPNSSPRKRIFFRIMWILYFTIYVWLQAAPLYVLSEVQSICKNIQRIVHIGNANHLTNFRLNTVLDYFNGILPQIWIDKNLNLQPAVWDNDDWTFGQVLALSLWIPTVLDFFYALLSMFTRLTCITSSYWLT